MAEQKLVSYVRSSLQNGLPISKIRSDLYKAGWKEKDIEDAISLAGGAPMKNPLPATPAGPENPGQGSRKKLYIVLLIVLIAVGAATYYLVSNYILSIPPVIKPTENATCGDGNCSGSETYEICPSDCQGPPVNQDLKVGIKQPSRTVNSGNTVIFDVEISSVSDLYGFQFGFEYNPLVLQFTKAAEGTFLNKNDQDSTFCIDPKANASGATSTLTIACTRLGPIGGVSGNGTLETLTFTAISSGSVEAKISNVKLVDSSAKRISLPG